MRLFAVVWFISSLCSIASFAQDVPTRYQHFFVQKVDKRALPERALNLAGLTSQDVGQSFALIAGVTRYPNMPPLQQRLEPAEADIEELQKYLREEEFFDEIVVLKDSDVSYDNLRYFLEVYFPERLKRAPKSRFLFAYSGHGTSEGSSGYLLTSGASNLEDKANSINLRVVRDLVEDVVEAGYQVLVLINACYSGAFLQRSFGPSSYLPRYPGAHAITAGGANERAWHDPSLGRGSVFFEKLFAGLGGQADTEPLNADGTRGDGIVTVDELASYLKQEIRISSDQHQNPMAGDISKNGSLGGFFFLNRGRQLAKGNVKEWNPAGSFGSGTSSDSSLIVRRDPSTNVPRVSSTGKQPQPSVVRPSSPTSNPSTFSGSKLSKRDSGNKTVCILLVRGDDLHGKPIFAYVSVAADKLQAFMEAQQKGEFYPEKFGEVIESGEGEPPPEVRRKMETEYGFDHEGMIDVPSAGHVVKAGYYLEVGEVPRDSEELTAVTLMQKGFHVVLERGVLSQPMKVLVGPLKDERAISDARAKLEGDGFKATPRQY